MVDNVKIIRCCQKHSDYIAKDNESLEFGHYASKCTICHRYSARTPYQKKYRKIYNKKYNDRRKELNKEYLKKYKEKNLEAIRKKQKEYRINNKEKIKQKYKKYIENNREYVRERARKYVLKNEEKYKKLMSGYFKYHKDNLTEYYVRRRIIGKSKLLKNKDIDENMVEVKRILLKIFRKKKCK